MKTKSKIAFVLVLSMLLTACAGEAGPQGEQGAQGEPGQVSEDLVKAAVAEALAEPEEEVGGKLVIYSGRKESLVSDVIAAFAAETFAAFVVRQPIG